jgi:hypothetical protein
LPVASLWSSSNPKISWRLAKKTILKMLDLAFQENYRALLDAVEVMRDYDNQPDELKEKVNWVVQQIAGSITKERYTHYKDTQKAVLYEADEGYRLGKFYVLIQRALGDFPKNRELITLSVNFGAQHAELRGMRPTERLGIFVEAFNWIKNTPSCSV